METWRNWSLVSKLFKPNACWVVEWFSLKLFEHKSEGWKKRILLGGKFEFNWSEKYLSCSNDLAFRECCTLSGEPKMHFIYEKHMKTSHWRWVKCVLRTVGWETLHLAAAEKLKTHIVSALCIIMQLPSMDLQYKTVLSLEINTSRSVLYSNLSTYIFHPLQLRCFVEKNNFVNQKGTELQLTFCFFLQLSASVTTEFLQ